MTENNVEKRKQEGTDVGLQEFPADGVGSITSLSDQPDLPTIQPLSGITTYQKLTFTAVCLAYVSNLISMSIIAPFFPVEAEKKNVSHIQIFLIFAVFNLVSFVASPIWGKLLPILGAKFTLLAGCWISGGCNIIFGFLDELEDSTQFLIFCYIVRILEAVGAAASLTAGMAIAANAFPDNVAQIMGWLEVCRGIGYATGPPLGGILYMLGGYKLPFMVQGGGTVVITFVNIFVLPSQGLNDTQYTGSYQDFWKIPAVWPVSLVVLVGSAGLGFIDPTLAIHLEQFHLSSAIVGFVFILTGGCYAIFSPIWGYIVDVKKTTRLMMILGFLVTAIAYLLIGPSKILKLPNELWIVCLGLGMQGCFVALGIVPTYLDMLTSAIWYGLPDNLATQSIVSGQINAMISLGQFIGPVAAGVWIDRVGFPTVSSYFTCADILVVIVVSLFGAWEYQCCLGRRQPKFKKKTSSEDETSELIPEARTRE